MIKVGGHSGSFIIKVIIAILLMGLAGIVKDAKAGRIIDIIDCLKESLLAICIFLPLAIWFSIMSERTIIFADAGITIKYLCFKKTYEWGQYVTIHHEMYDDIKSDFWAYDEGIFFSLYPYRRKRGRSPHIYCLWTHPWSSICVTFLNNDQPRYWGKGKKPVPKAAYHVDKRLFTEQLGAWGILFTEGGKVL